MSQILDEEFFDVNDGEDEDENEIRRSKSTKSKLYDSNNSKSVINNRSTYLSIENLDNRRQRLFRFLNLIKFMLTIILMLQYTISLLFLLTYDLRLWIDYCPKSISSIQIFIQIFSLISIIGLFLVWQHDRFHLFWFFLLINFFLIEIRFEVLNRFIHYQFDDIEIEFYGDNFSNESIIYGLGQCAIAMKIWLAINIDLNLIGFAYSFIFNIGPYLLSGCHFLSNRCCYCIRWICCRCCYQRRRFRYHPHQYDRNRLEKSQHL
ncbi:hypothetical protein SSS_04976 [Sarcoptes scabiei]|uniref:Uncharacterized protein n=1 Tax=Sarcoptes scabiei TaxID=52283 RepID=A0A834VFT5_SARSC|nr:hypothetical protein SSS_04976 [Sarcoptes scabiei]